MVCVRARVRLFSCLNNVSSLGLLLAQSRCVRWCVTQLCCATTLHPPAMPTFPTVFFLERSRHPIFKCRPVFVFLWWINRLRDKRSAHLQGCLMNCRWHCNTSPCLHCVCQCSTLWPSSPHLPEDHVCLSLRGLFFFYLNIKERLSTRKKNKTCKQSV